MNNTLSPLPAQAASAIGDALDSVAHGASDLRDTVPTAITRAAADAEALTRRGIERARQASEAVRLKAERLSDNTVTYIKDEPIKAVLLAAGAGAMVALVIGWFSRSRDPR